MAGLEDDRGGAEQAFLPALRWRRLTPIFDQVVRLTTRETKFKRLLLDQARVGDGEAVLDLGAGTGTLAIQLRRLCPSAQVTGLDADPDVLARARRKAAEAEVRVEFIEGFSTQLPFPDLHFDVALSTLFFHHLSDADKARSLAEVARVLKPGGRLHVADYDSPADPLMALLFLAVRTFDGFDVTRANARGALPEMFEAAGLTAAKRHKRLRTAFGTLALYSARRSSS
jgi:SAM-dependent methyltransferase